MIVGILVMLSGVIFVLVVDEEAFDILVVMITVTDAVVGDLVVLPIVCVVKFEFGI